MIDWFTSNHGAIDHRLWRFRRRLPVIDAAQDAVQRFLGIRARALRRAGGLPRQRVLLAAVEVPGREADLGRVLERLRESRHGVTVATIPMQPRGKMANINAAIAPFDLSEFDWLLIVDDDIDFGAGFLDLLLAEASHRGFRLAMPAHRQPSFASFKVTLRHWGTASRRTGYVEIGPVTLLHRETFSALLPFPELRWAWGIDIHWANVAASRGWPIGVVDIATIRHLRPIAGTYRSKAAGTEAEAFLAAQGDDLPRSMILRNFARYR
jgi:hypothetical protein